MIVKPLLATLALVPMVSGPMSHSQEGQALLVKLCGGGELAIPLGDGPKEPEPDCQMKGCHACNNREKGKRGNRV